MAYIIIGFVLLLIIGPIIAVLPSKRQKAQMAMRKVAMSAGISVELTSISDPNPKQDKYLSNTGKALAPTLKVIAYRLQRKREGHWRRLPPVSWCLQKKREAQGELAPWVWTQQSDEMSGDLAAWLEGELPGLPGDVEQIEEAGYNIAVYWHEKKAGDELPVIAFLKACAELPLRKTTDDEPGEA
jgi:hypothetical protein